MISSPAHRGTHPRATTTTKPGRLFRWQVLTVGLMLVGYSGYYLCRSDFSVALPLIADELVARGLAPGFVRIRLGAIASLGVMAYAAGKFPAGAIADFLGGKRNFLGGMIGSTAFTLLFALAGGLPLFSLAWIGNRLVQSLGWGGMVKISSRWFSYHRYGTVMGIISLSFLFGDAISRTFMAWLIGHGLGWRGIVEESNIRRENCLTRYDAVETPYRRIVPELAGDFPVQQFFEGKWRLHVRLRLSTTALRIPDPRFLSPKNGPAFPKTAFKRLSHHC
ncbi:MAG: MFS transporter [Terriglobales bacterium]